MGQAARKTKASSKTLGIEEYKGLADNAPVNIMYADLDMQIIYANPKSIETLRRLEDHIPISADQLVGSSIDVFHKNPLHQRRMLKDDSMLPHKAIIGVGPEKLELLVNAVYKGGKYVGAMVTWDIITEKVRLVE